MMQCAHCHLASGKVLAALLENPKNTVSVTLSSEAITLKFLHEGEERYFYYTESVLFMLVVITPSNNCVKNSFVISVSTDTENTDSFDSFCIPS